MAFPMTVAEFEEHVSTTLGNDAIQRLLDDAEEAIIERAGPTVDGYTVDDLTERFPFVSGDALMLSRRATAITQVLEHAERETPTTLAANDYALSPSGMMLRRKRGGSNPSTCWLAEVEVSYTPYSDNARRVIAQLELCRLEIAFNPNLSMQVIGSWTEQYTGSRPYGEQREEILSRLASDPVVAY